MKLYVASSWRNLDQPLAVRALRNQGHEVYDFRHPSEGDSGFHWSQIDLSWQTWTPANYRDGLDHPIARAGFVSDMDALRHCDAVVGVQPFGRSASLKLGWACGAEKLTILLLAPGEPELMVKMCDHICLDINEVIGILDRKEKEDEMSKAQGGLPCRPY